MNSGGLSNHFHQERPHLPPAGNWRRLRPCWFWGIFLDSWTCQECDFEGQPARPAAWEAEAFQQLLGAVAHFHCLGAITVELNWVNESMAGRREEPQFHLFLQDARPGPAQGVPSCLWISAPRVPGRKPSTLPHSSGHKMNSLKGMAVCISRPLHLILGCDLRPPEAPPLQAAAPPHTPTLNTAGPGLDSPTLRWPPQPCYCLSQNLAFPSSAFPFVFR